MKILLDTCTFLWILLDAPELSESARALVMDPDNEIFLSAVSDWEIALKWSLGRLPFPDEPSKYVPAQRNKHGISSLALDEESALHVIRLPEFHRDPFDRMLVSQALVHGLVILTPDRLVSQYPARVTW
ncbi:MAG TPA: type II toxin-antitoxin system VapC family toxin [Bdellovibrionota bacterium]|nr:type II toxin-antitoxin system VapC family toxin [Bdellovibrionota bacterium]